MSFIRKWYYDTSAVAARRLLDAAERHGVTEPLRFGDYQMSLALDDLGVPRILFETLGEEAPSLHLLTNSLRPHWVLGDSPGQQQAWLAVWAEQGDHFSSQSSASLDRIDVKPLPDISRPITVGGETYHRLALTHWYAGYGGSGYRTDEQLELEKLVLGLQDTPNIRSAIPLARALVDNFGMRNISLVDDDTNYTSVGNSIGQGGRVPGHGYTFGKGLGDIGIQPRLQLALTKINPAMSVIDLPSGAFVPGEVVEATPTGLSGDPLERKVVGFARSIGSSAIYLRSIGSATLVGREVGGQRRLRLFLREGQQLSEADDAIAALAAIARNGSRMLGHNRPEYGDEDVAAIQRLFMGDEVRKLLTLPLRRLDDVIHSSRGQLDDALSRVARYSEEWSRAVAAKENLSAGISDEQVGLALGSLDRAGKIGSLTVSDDIIMATTNTVHIQDDRSGAWHRIGKFRITIDARSLSIKYQNLTDRVAELNYGTHPHIRNDGTACVGNFSLIASQLVAANDWLGLVEMCVVFLSNANTRDPAGKHLHWWPFVEKPEEVGLPAYPEGFSGPMDRNGRLLGEPDSNGRILYDVGFEEEGNERRSFEDILDDPMTGDELLLYSERTRSEIAFLYDDYEGDWYDHAGYDRDGYNSSGYDENGYDRDGYDEDGFDSEGYNRSGYDRYGYDQYGYDDDGFDEEGYSRVGLNRAGLTRDEEAATA